jgi:hypothetical protein
MPRMRMVVALTPAPAAAATTANVVMMPSFAP